MLCDAGLRRCPPTDSLRVADAATAALLNSIEPSYHAWFTQADYVIYPWLQGTVRYETLTPGDTTVPSLRTGVANVSALVRVILMRYFDAHFRQRSSSGRAADL